MINQIDDLISGQTCLLKLLILEWKLGYNGGVLLHGLDINGCVIILIEDLIEDVHPLSGQYVTVLIPKIIQSSKSVHILSRYCRIIICGETTFVAFVCYPCQ